jgi:hypothetical protein
MIFIVQFGVIFSILFNGITKEEYQGISQFGYLIMAFRISTGELSEDDFYTLN